MCHGSSDLLPKLNIQYMKCIFWAWNKGKENGLLGAYYVRMHNACSCRFNEGVTDILAKSIVMVGAPREVFAEYKLSHVPTM